MRQMLVSPVSADVLLGGAGKAMPSSPTKTSRSPVAAAILPREAGRVLFGICGFTEQN